MIVGIIPAAGMGTRMVGSAQNKLFLTLKGTSILILTLKALDSFGIDHFILAVREEEMAFVRNLINSEKWNASFDFIVGGKERQDSIENALRSLPEKSEMVVVHDGARPFIDVTTYQNTLLEAQKTGAAIAAVPTKDTVKKVGRDQWVETTYDRSEIWLTQTPQIFFPKVLMEAYENARREKFVGTDDASLVERMGIQVKIVMGNYQNIKITTPDDLIIGETILNTKEKNPLRIGKGFDIHRLVEGRPCILGGENIPHSKGLLGHSDADVLSHAISDALLGAAGLGDIGVHFPDTDQAYEGADSIELLKKVVSLLVENNWEIQNVDATVMAERPKISPYVSKIKANLAAAMQIDSEQVNIKGTTAEKLGFIGREEGIAAEAVALLKKKNS